MILLELFIDVLLEAVIDTAKMLPFLLLTFWLMEYLESRPAVGVQRLMNGSVLAPIAGGLLGLLPQCGFSAAAASLYSRGAVTVGTLLAVFIATSDEAVPMLLASPQSYPLLLKLLAAKLALGIGCGLALDFVARRIHLPQPEHGCSCHICEEEQARGSHLSLLASAALHTLNLAAFIFGVSLVLGGLLALIGEEALARLLMSGSIWQPLAAGLIGFIPNCASSVLLTRLLMTGSISFGAALAGLTTSAGVGLLVLLRNAKVMAKKDKKVWPRLIGFLGLLYAIAVIAGIAADMVI